MFIMKETGVDNNVNCTLYPSIYEYSVLTNQYRSSSEALAGQWIIHRAITHGEVLPESSVE